jgi:hypothetical protein
MDFETFMRAIDSLDGYEGLIGTIGGESLLHLEYSIFAEYLQSKRNYKGIRNKSIDGTRSKAILNDYLGFATTQRWIDGALNRGKGYLMH